jgi:hypothetical protein
MRPIFFSGGGACDTLPTLLPNADNKYVVPDRLFDNIQSGFALWLSWQELTASALQLQQYVATAKAKSSTLIDNTRARRMRNA